MEINKTKTLIETIDQLHKRLDELRAELIEKYKLRQSYEQNDVVDLRSFAQVKEEIWDIEDEEIFLYREINRISMELMA